MTALSLAAPNRTSKNSGEFLSRNATRSCEPTPSERSPLATRLDRVSRSPKLSGSRPVHEGRLVGPLRALLADEVGQGRAPHRPTVPFCDEGGQNDACHPTCGVV